MSRPHCCERSGSAADAPAGMARQSSRATRHASVVRMASVSPARPCANPLSGADALILNELQYIPRAPAERRRGLGGLVRAYEVERLLRLVDERHQAFVAAEAARLVAQDFEERRQAAVGVAAEQHHRAPPVDAVRVLG